MPLIYEIETTPAFDKWLKKLRDRKAVLAVAARLDRAKLGNFGDVKSVGGEISEMRIFVGPGYRLYYVIQDGRIILLLCGGNKSTQERDIKKAKNMVKQLGEEES
ncbi:MAG: type II toxin-antitoxin system RelE/ParE family toxin [Candidatus Electrothrix sp. GW3-4]|uniref:type II toxin-antitoxin system RelE/ParE family toxin n=1 Tax=Candidatus Electrothrix sp. GW3-4 TaxID=3126740 RepID=UPI0030CAF030